jgi:hypothetical protein
MLATALAVCACQQGRRVRFTTLAGLANELQEAESRRELARVVGRYARTELVVLDELGYLALPDGAAELVFQVHSERHERGSPIVTTNPPFGEWTNVFPTPGSPRPSSTASPTAPTSSTPAPSPGASATASPARPTHPRPPPDERTRAPARRSASPHRARLPDDGRAAPHPPRQARSTDTTTRRELGPLQAVAVWPLQAIASNHQIRLSSRAPGGDALRPTSAYRSATSSWTTIGGPIGCPPRSCTRETAACSMRRSRRAERLFPPGRAAVPPAGRSGSAADCTDVPPARRATSEAEAIVWLAEQVPELAPSQRNLRSALRAGTLIETWASRDLKSRGGK